MRLRAYCPDERARVDTFGPPVRSRPAFDCKFGLKLFVSAFALSCACARALAACFEEFWPVGADLRPGCSSPAKALPQAFAAA